MPYTWELQTFQNIQSSLKGYPATAPNATSPNISLNIWNDAEKEVWGSGIPLAPKKKQKQIPRTKS